MHCPAVLLLLTCACVSVTSSRLSPIDSHSLELVNPAIIPEFNLLPNNGPLSPISQFSLIFPRPIELTSPDYLLQSSLLPPIALPPGWCIPDIIRIPLVPCTKPLSPIIPIPKSGPLRIPAPLPTPWPLPSPLHPNILPIPTPRPWPIPTPLPKPWPHPISFPDIEPIPPPGPWPRPIPFPDIEPIPPLGPWPRPIPYPDIEPIAPLVPWPRPIPYPDMEPILPLGPWPRPIPYPEIEPISPLGPWPQPISYPDIEPILPLGPWPRPIPFHDIEPIKIPLQRPWPRPIPYPDIEPIPPLGPWPHPITYPDIEPIPTLGPWLRPIPFPDIEPIAPLGPWPHPTPYLDIEPILPLGPWPHPMPYPDIKPIPPIGPWPRPIPFPDIEPMPMPPLKPWPQPIPSPEILPIPPSNPWPIPLVKTWPKPEPFPLIPIRLEVPVWPLPRPDSMCEEYLQWNPGFVEEYVKALVLVEQALMDILRHIEIQEVTGNESTRQYLAIMAVWKALQDNTSGNSLIIPTQVYNSIVEATVPLALNNPELVVEIVTSRIKVYLDATVNIQRLIKTIAQHQNSVFIKSYIATLVRRNPSLQLEANLLLQLGVASSAYLTLVPTFDKVSEMGCVMQYLKNSQYDVMQLVERSYPACRSLNALTLK